MTKPNSNRLSIPLFPSSNPSPRISHTPSSSLSLPGITPSTPTTKMGTSDKPDKPEKYEKPERPTKPRSDSLMSTRPAPPSPASRPSSRPPSQIYSPHVSRDRSGSTGSRVLRRVSGASRRRSTLSNSIEPSSNPIPPTTTKTINTTSGEENVASTSENRMSVGTLKIGERSTGSIPELTEKSETRPEQPSSSTLTVDVTSGESVKIMKQGEETKGGIGEKDKQVEKGKQVEKEEIRFKIIIKDYAYPTSDNRHYGIYPLPPPPSRESRQSLGGWRFPNPLSSPNKESDKKSWSGFGLLNWKGFRRSSSSNENSPDPNSNDDEQFDESIHHFDENGNVINYDGYDSNGQVNLGGDDDDDFEINNTLDDEGYSFSDGEELEEPFGLYKAMYDFVPEGPHEIGMKEGDLMDVRGWGGGEGWVVVVIKENENEEEKTGLVPAGFIEKVEERTKTPSEMGSGEGMVDDQGGVMINEEEERKK
ncbi:hypothetical protein M231_05130 [Tremella mesenterica]|uniref:SH3 domain-containing protein n=1 Tax=Tremella mesenterica TaxID=5217 RepID=A0A4Q1BIU4_TREME|nr:hypothetical protein M231_05130 [Tremella mesenterica]